MSVKIKKTVFKFLAERAGEKKNICVPLRIQILDFPIWRAYGLSIEQQRTHWRDLLGSIY